MEINTRMAIKLQPYYYEELDHSKRFFHLGDFQKSWYHLERAHVIGQSYPWQHSYAHWKMLLFGFHIKNSKEIIGQIPRLLFGGTKSFVGKVPVGNTGGADIPPLKSLPICTELQTIFKEADITNYE